MNRIQSIAFVFIFSLAVTSGWAQKFQFSLPEIASHDPVHLTWKQQKGSRNGWIECRNDTFPWSFTLPGADEGYAWNTARYLVVEIEHQNPVTLRMMVDFYSEHYKTAQAEARFTVGILPNLITQVVFPIRSLSERIGFIPRFPRQINGKVEGFMSDPTRIKKTLIQFSDLPVESLMLLVKVHNLYLAKDLPQALPPVAKPLVDSLGQLSFKYWPGKAQNSAALRKQIQTQPGFKASLQPESQRLTGNPILELPTGFYKTHFDGKRWWLVDPKGHPFLSSGVNHIRPSVSGPVNGNEDLFAYLPDPAGEGQGLYFQSRGMWHYNFLAHNLRTAFGNTWQKHWRSQTLAFLQNTGFNTLGILTEIELLKSSKMPFVLLLRNFPLGKKCLFRDFPDVFDPFYTDSLRLYASQLEELKNDQLLIGYFLGNEPEWASDNANLALQMLKEPQKSHSRTELVRWLSTKYNGRVEKLNLAWTESFSSFSELDSGSVHGLGIKAQEDLALFSGVLVDSLVARVCRSVKSVDPHHLNLGFRFTYIRPDLCHRAKDQFDVFSINGNGPQPPAFTEDISQRTGKPVLITEFMVGSTDRGLLSSGIVAVKNQEHRGWAIQNYLENGFARPEIIGIHYFQLYDQPVLGRFDGENYGIGLLDVCHRPYADPVTGFKLAHKRMYRLATGKRRPRERSVQFASPIWF